MSLTLGTSSSESVICLTSDSEPENAHSDHAVHVLSSDNDSDCVPNKKISPTQPSNFLLVKYGNDSSDTLVEKLRLAKVTLEAIRLSAKDGGEKVRQQIDDLECVLHYRNPQQYNPSSTKAVVPSVPQIIQPRPAKFNEEVYNQLYTNDAKRLFGGKMTDNRLDRVEHVTEVALRVMHNAMSSVPEEHHIVESPEGLKIDLMQHQKQGLAWLTWRETQRPPCGILADDMGLGKTLSMISLVLHQKNELRKRKDEGDLEEYNKRRMAAKKNGYIPSNATLVVAPASLIYQWEQEVQRRVENGRLRVAIFHGHKNKRESDPIRLASNDIVITTYNLVTTELTERITTANNAEHSSDDSDDDDDNWGAQASVAKDKKQKNKISKNSNSILAKICWARIILDEAHQIKNKGTGASKAACRLAATARWCLTGTPIHNNLWDLYSLIRFMRVAPFDEEKHWKEYIMSSTKKATDRLNLLVKSLLLRRTKSQTSSLTNKPLVDLQPKVLKKHELVLEGIEAQVYDVMFRATQQKVKQMLSEADNQRLTQLYGYHRRKAEKGQEMRNPFNFGPRTIGADDKFQQMSCMLVMLLRLRQACVHMHLTKQAVDMDAFENIGADETDADDLLDQTLANLTLEDEEGHQITAAAIFERDYMSCKIKKLMEIVDEVLVLNDKIVIVSQWTSLLDIVEEKLKARSSNYTSITGKVLPVDRQERVDSFNKEKGGAQVMLLSLTAGGVGLNLIGGNHLVMVDLHWNPALEAQACDRIYRMGQKKTVYIHRLVTNGTIEQRVVDLQEKKLELAGSVLEGAASRKLNKITMADLRFLFDLDKKEGRNVPIQIPSTSNPPYRNPFAPGPVGSVAQNNSNSGKHNPSSSGIDAVRFFRDNKGSKQA